MWCLLPVLLLLTGCERDRQDWRPGGSKDTASTYTSPGGDGGEDANVVELWDTGASWDCLDDPESCIGSYLALPDAAASHAHPISESELEEQLEAMENGEVVIHSEDAVTDSELDDIVQDALNMDFLTGGLDERELKVTVLYEEDKGAYTERHLIFDDPWVGDFFGILLVPEGAAEAAVPGVLSVHGHGQQAGDVIDDLFGDQYPSHGYALLTFTFRGMGADANEDEVTRALLLEGFTFEAVRIYESLLALKYLRWLPEVDASRLAVVGHSGGSLAWNLAVRDHPPIEALVTDLRGTYFDLWKGWVLDDTLPAVHPYYPAVNLLEGTGVPTLVVDYSYQEEFDDIVDFLDTHLDG